MLRQDEKVGKTHELPVDVAPDQQGRRKPGVRWTAWVIGAVAVAFYVASLVEGHLSHIPH